MAGSGLDNLHSLLVYIEQGRSSTGTTLTFTTASTSGITWKAKVTQIECSRWVSNLFSIHFSFTFQSSKFTSSSFCNWNETSNVFLNVSMQSHELPLCCNSKQMGAKYALLFQLTKLFEII